MTKKLLKKETPSSSSTSQSTSKKTLYNVTPLMRLAARSKKYQANTYSIKQTEHGTIVEEEDSLIELTKLLHTAEGKKSLFATDSRGNTALDWARIHKNYPAVTILLHAMNTYILNLRVKEINQSKKLSYDTYLLKLNHFNAIELYNGLIQNDVDFILKLLKNNKLVRSEIESLDEIFFIDYPIDLINKKKQNIVTYKKSYSNFNPLMLAISMNMMPVVDELVTNFNVDLNPKLIEFQHTKSENPSQQLNSSTLIPVALPTKIGLKHESLYFTRTPLMVAVASGLSDLTHYLLFHGADIYAKNPVNLQTVFHMACYYSKAKVFKILLQFLIEKSVEDRLISHNLVEFDSNRWSFYIKMIEDLLFARDIDGNLCTDLLPSKRKALKGKLTGPTGISGSSWMIREGIRVENELLSRGVKNKSSLKPYSESSLEVDNLLYKTKNISFMPDSTNIIEDLNAEENDLEKENILEIQELELTDMDENPKYSNELVESERKRIDKDMDLQKIVNKIQVQNIYDPQFDPNDLNDDNVSKLMKLKENELQDNSQESLPLSSSKIIEEVIQTEQFKTPEINDDESIVSELSMDELDSEDEIENDSVNKVKLVDDDDDSKNTDNIFVKEFKEIQDVNSIKSHGTFSNEELYIRKYLNKIKKKLKQWKLNEKIENKLQQLIVCPLNCGLQIKHEDLRYHLTTECINRTYQCQLCYKIIQFKKKIVHENKECQNRFIYCPNIKDGCTDYFPYNTLSYHLKLHCQNRLIQCRLYCGKKIVFKNRIKHEEKDCPNRLVQCSECLANDIKSKDYLNHKNNICPKKKIRCSVSCGQLYCRESLKDHEENDCKNFCKWNCGQKIGPPTLLHYHENYECDKKIVECNNIYCYEKKFVNKKFLINHTHLLCKKRRSRCINGCGELVSKENMNSHINYFSGSCIVRKTFCPYNFVGWSVWIKDRDEIGIILKYDRKIIHETKEDEINYNKNKLMMLLYGNNEDNNLTTAHKVDDFYYIRTSSTHIYQKVWSDNYNLLERKVNLLDNNESVGNETNMKLLTTNDASVGNSEIISKKNITLSNFEPECGTFLYYELENHINNLCPHRPVRVISQFDEEKKGLVHGTHEKISNDPDASKNNFYGQVTPYNSLVQVATEKLHVEDREVNEYNNTTHIRCEFCNIFLPQESLLDHKEYECLNYPIFCPLGCNKKIPRKWITSHSLDDCPKRLVSCYLCHSSDLWAEELENHINNFCLDRLVECTNNCGQKVIARDLNHHLNSLCPTRQIQCICGYTLNLKNLKEHQELDCSYREVSCPHIECGIKMKYYELENHLELVCKSRHHIYEKVIECPNGCGSRMMQKDLLFHSTNECEFRLIECPQYCGVIVMLESLKNHFIVCKNRVLACDDGVHVCAKPIYKWFCSPEECEKILKRQRWNFKDSNSKLMLTNTKKLLPRFIESEDGNICLTRQALKALLSLPKYNKYKDLPPLGIDFSDYTYNNNEEKNNEITNFFKNKNENTIEINYSDNNNNANKNFFNNIIIKKKNKVTQNNSAYGGNLRLSPCGLHGVTLLMVAIKQKNSALFESVLSSIKNKDDLNMINSQGDTALTLACRLRELEFVELLIQRGADVNMETFNGKTPLIEAVKSDVEDIPLIECLIKHGAFVAYRTKRHNRSALDWARRYAYTEFEIIKAKSFREYEANEWLKENNIKKKNEDDYDELNYELYLLEKEDEKVDDINLDEAEINHASIGITSKEEKVISNTNIVNGEFVMTDERRRLLGRPDTVRILELAAMVEYQSNLMFSKIAQGDVDWVQKMIAEGDPFHPNNEENSYLVMQKYAKEAMDFDRILVICQKKRDSMEQVRIKREKIEEKVLKNLSTVESRSLNSIEYEKSIDSLINNLFSIFEKNANRLNYVEFNDILKLKSMPVILKLSCFSLGIVFDLFDWKSKIYDDLSIYIDKIKSLYNNNLNNSLYDTDELSFIASEVINYINSSIVSWWSPIILELANKSILLNKLRIFNKAKLNITYQKKLFELSFVILHVFYSLFLKSNGIVVHLFDEFDVEKNKRGEKEKKNKYISSMAQSKLPSLHSDSIQIPNKQEIVSKMGQEIDLLNKEIHNAEISSNKGKLNDDEIPDWVWDPDAIMPCAGSWINGEWVPKEYSTDKWWEKLSTNWHVDEEKTKHQKDLLKKRQEYFVDITEELKNLNITESHSTNFASPIPEELTVKNNLNITQEIKPKKFEFYVPDYKKIKKSKKNYSIDCFNNPDLDQDLQILRLSRFILSVSVEDVKNEIRKSLEESKIKTEEETSSVVTKTDISEINSVNEIGVDQKDEKSENNEIKENNENSKNSSNVNSLPFSPPLSPPPNYTSEIKSNMPQTYKNNTINSSLDELKDDKEFNFYNLPHVSLFEFIYSPNIYRTIYYDFNPPSINSTDPNADDFIDVIGYSFTNTIIRLLKSLMGFYYLNPIYLLAQQNSILNALKLEKVHSQIDREFGQKERSTQKWKKIEADYVQALKKSKFLHLKVSKWKEKVRIARLVNRVSQSGHTAVSYAAALGELRIVDALLRQGASAGPNSTLCILASKLIQKSVLIYLFKCQEKYIEIDIDGNEVMVQKKIDFDSENNYNNNNNNNNKQVDIKIETYEESELSKEPNEEISNDMVPYFANKSKIVEEKYKGPSAISKLIESKTKIKNSKLHIPKNYKQVNMGFAEKLLFNRKLKKLLDIQFLAMTEFKYYKHRLRTVIPEATYTGKWEIIEHVALRKNWHYVPFINSYIFPLPPPPYSIPYNRMSRKGILYRYSEQGGAGPVRILPDDYNDSKEENFLYNDLILIQDNQLNFDNLNKKNYMKRSYLTIQEIYSYAVRDMASGAYVPNRYDTDSDSEDEDEANSLVSYKDNSSVGSIQLEKQSNSNLSINEIDRLNIFAKKVSDVFVQEVYDNGTEELFKLVTPLVVKYKDYDEQSYNPKYDIFRNKGWVEPMEHGDPFAKLQVVLSKLIFNINFKKKQHYDQRFRIRVLRNEECNQIIGEYKMKQYIKSKDFISCMNLVIMKGITADLETDDGFTMLISAAEEDDQSLNHTYLKNDDGNECLIVSYLLDRYLYRPSINIVTSIGYTALIRAAMLGRTSVLCALLDRGAEIDLQNQEGKTALHYAAEAGHTKTVELLVERGANPNIKDKYNHTPYEIAEEYNFIDVCKILAQNQSGNLGELKLSRGQIETRSFCQRGCGKLYFPHEKNYHLEEECELRIVKCTNNCSDTGIIFKELQDHLTRVCRKRLVTCKSCLKQIKDEELDFHMTEYCEVRLLPCKLGCPRMVKWNEMDRHLSNCPKRVTTCPLFCGISLTYESHQNHIENECSHRKISCPLKCRTLIMVKDLEKHKVNQCLNRLIRCPDCQTDLQFGQLNVHLSEVCPFRHVECPYKCDVKVNICKLNDHLSNDCPRRLVTCVNNCGGKIYFSGLSKHLNKECPNRLVECPNGCRAFETLESNDDFKEIIKLNTIVPQNSQNRREQKNNPKPTTVYDSVITPNLSQDQSFDILCPILKVPQYQLDAHLKYECTQRKVTCSLCLNPSIVYSKLSEHHENDCENRLVNCTWPGCSKKLKYSELIEHTNNDCKFRIVLCDFGCNKQLKFMNLKIHKARDCENRPTTCSHCSLVMKYYQLENHLENECYNYTTKDKKKKKENYN